MQRTKTSSTSASAALRRTLRAEPNSEDHDHLSDPRPWETRAPLRLYGSSRDAHPALSLDHSADLPLYDDMETRRRYGDKEVVIESSEKAELLDDQGKWAKGHGAGPGVGGKRGLPAKQRVGGWVSVRVQQRS